MRETHRFETLVNYFTNPQEFQIEFMVACMQFINIVVHSVEVRQSRPSLSLLCSFFSFSNILSLPGHELPSGIAVRVHSVAP